MQDFYQNYYLIFLTFFGAYLFSNVITFLHRTVQLIITVDIISQESSRKEFRLQLNYNKVQQSNLV